jgi:hypothetical protein
MNTLHRAKQTRHPHPNLLPEGEVTSARSWGVLGREEGTSSVPLSSWERRTRSASEGEGVGLGEGLGEGWGEGNPTVRVNLVNDLAS